MGSSPPYWPIWWSSRPWPRILILKSTFLNVPYLTSLTSKTNRLLKALLKNHLYERNWSFLMHFFYFYYFFKNLIFFLFYLNLKFIFHKIYEVKIHKIIKIRFQYLLEFIFGKWNPICWESLKGKNSSGNTLWTVLFFLHCFLFSSSICF